MQSTSSQSPPDSSIIRTGSDGRLRFSPEQRREFLLAFDRCGLSAMAFCRQHGIAYQTFIAWLRKRRVLDASPPPVDAPAFAEVMIHASQGSPSALRVVLPCGTVMEIQSRAALPLAAELLQNLRRPC